MAKSLPTSARHHLRKCQKSQFLKQIIYNGNCVKNHPFWRIKMRKYYLILTICVAVLVFLPETTKAQYTNPYETYRTNDLIRRMPKKKSVHKRAGKTNRLDRHKSSKKSVRRKKRHISQRLEIINPGSEFVLGVTRRNKIIL